MNKLNEFTNGNFESTLDFDRVAKEQLTSVIPPRRVRYLSEIVETNREYDQWAEEQAAIAQQAYALEEASKILKEENKEFDLESLKNSKLELLSPENKELILNWEEKKKKYSDEIYSFKVRDKEIKIETHTESLSHLQIPKVDRKSTRLNSSHVAISYAVFSLKKNRRDTESE